MRVLKYAILGLLNHKSMTGYEISTEFKSALNEFWSAKHSQIYPELKKLVDEGMATFEVEISGNVLEKKVYTITEEGRRDFLQWLATDQPMEATPKDVFRLRVFFSDDLDKTTRIELLESHLAQHEQRLDYLRNILGKFEGVDDLIGNHLMGDYMVLTGAIMREEMSCQWVKKCIELLEN